MPPEILSRIQAARLNGGATAGLNAFGFTGPPRNAMNVDERDTADQISPQQQINLLQQTFTRAAPEVVTRETAARDMIALAARLGVRPEHLIIAQQREQHRARTRTAEGEDRTMGGTVGLLPNGAMRDIAETRHRHISHGTTARPATTNNSPHSAMPDRIERNQMFDYTNTRAPVALASGHTRTAAVANPYPAGRAVTPNPSPFVSSPPGARGLLAQTDTVMHAFTRGQLPGRGGEVARGRQR